MFRISLFLLLSTFLSLFPTLELFAQQMEAETVSSAVQVEASTDIDQPTLEEEEEPLIEFLLPTEHHPWGRFEPGAWREYQITTETFDAEGQLLNRSLTTQKEILEAVDAETYTLKVQATVDLIGKRIVGDWKTQVLHWTTDGTGEITQTVQREASKFTVEGSAVECQLWELTYRNDARFMVDRIHYQPQRFPYVLKRETLEQEQAESVNAPEHAIELVVWNVPYSFQGNLVMCSCMKSLQQRPKGKSSRVSFSSPEVPGGEIVAWTSDFDSDGQLTRWSTMELLGSGSK